MTSGIPEGGSDGPDEVCLSSCRGGVNLGATDCPYVRRSFTYMSDIGREEFWRCTKTSFDFKVRPQYADQSGSGQDVMDERAFRREYGANLRNTDRQDGIYFTVGYDQQQLRTGLLDRVRRSIEQVRPFAGALRILDVGCSSGVLLGQLRRALPAATIVGLDPSPVSCDLARSIGNVEVHCGTLAEVDLPATSFDVIIMIGNLMLHRNPFRSLEMVRELVAESGVLVVDVKNSRALPRILARRLARSPFKSGRSVRSVIRQAYKGIEYAFDRRWLESALQSTGWEVRRIETFKARRLEYRNEKTPPWSPVGAVWRAVSLADAIRGEQAWVQAIATAGVPDTRPSAGEA